MALAREMGMRQRPFPCRYCMADPMSSSISFATWCSVTVMVVSLLVDADAAWVPLVVFPPAVSAVQSPPPYETKVERERKKSGEGGKWVSERAAFDSSCCAD